jgi:hypothetical protein
MEAEYKSLSEGAKEGVYIKRLLEELKLLPEIQMALALDVTDITTDLPIAHVPTQIDLHLKCDNQGAVKLARNPMFHDKSKHIEAKHHYA